MSGYTLRAHAFVTAPLLTLAGVSIVVYSIVWNAIECALPVAVEQFAGQQMKQFIATHCWISAHASSMGAPWTPALLLLVAIVVCVPHMLCTRCMYGTGVQVLRVVDALQTRDNDAMHTTCRYMQKPRASIQDKSSRVGDIGFWYQQQQNMSRFGHCYFFPTIIDCTVEVYMMCATLYSVLGLLHSIYTHFSTSRRRSFIAHLLDVSLVQFDVVAMRSQVDRFVFNYLHVDGCLMLRLIDERYGTMCAADVAGRLWKDSYQSSCTETISTDYRRKTTAVAPTALNTTMLHHLQRMQNSEERDMRNADLSSTATSSTSSVTHRHV